MSDTAERLARLERENRWMRWMGGAAVLGLAGIVLMGQARPGPRIVEAEMFVVRDTTGKVRVILGPEIGPPTKAPSPPSVFPMGIHTDHGLYLFGADGRHRAALYESKHSSTLQLRDGSTPSEARLITMKGLATLNVWASNRTHAEEEERQAELSKKFNAAKSVEERLKLMPAMSAGHSASVSAWADRGPSVNLADDQGQQRAVLGHMELEIIRTGGTEQRPVSSLVLLNKDGTVVWRAP